MALIQFFNYIVTREVMFINERDDISLQDGSSGRCIFFYWLAGITKEGQYQKKAEELLDWTYQHLSARSYLDVKKGLFSVGLALNYILSKGYVKGESDRILGGLDEHAYRILMEKPEKVRKENVIVWLNSLLYYTFRLRYGIKSPDDAKIYSQLAYRLFNDVYQNFEPDFFYEPLPFSTDYRVVQFLWASVELHRMGIGRIRIERVWEEMKIYLFSIMPLCGGNRLSLMYAMQRIGNVLGGGNEWNTRALRLLNETDVETLIRNELKSHNLFFTEGICGLYLLLCACQAEELTVKYDPKLFIDKISASKIWDRVEGDKDYFKKHAGLDGFCGLATLIKQLEKNGY